jgi:hypothetical protein
MSSLLTQARSVPLRQVRSRFVAGVFVAAAAVLVFAGTLALLRRPDFVDHVTVVNRTKHAIDVDVDPGNGHEWMGLGGVEPRSTIRIDDVIDQGETWVFQMRNGGALVDEITVSRDQLKADGWRVVVSATPG